MSNETLFYILGSALVVVALVISFYGLRAKEFPPARSVMLGVGAFFAAGVIATATLAVLQAEDEQDHRNAELAAEEQEAAGEEGPPGAEGAGTVLELTSPEDGTTMFDPDGLEAAAGAITLNYDNPSPVAHNIAVESEGKVIGESDTVTDSLATLELPRLAPGEYTFFCTIPGHREGGMEGSLTVSGPVKP